MVWCGAQIKTSISVGVVGLPNVGKSSLINSLKRARVASVGSTPGVTRALQEVHLDKHVKLLDCPGVVMAASNPEDVAAAALRNAIRIEQLSDPLAPGQSLTCGPTLLLLEAEPCCYCVSNEPPYSCVDRNSP